MPDGGTPPSAAGRRCGSVRDWMTRAPLCVAEDTPIHAAIARMRTEGIRHLLVCEDDRLTGILSSRDLGRLVAESRPPRLDEPVRRIMTEGPATVGPDTPAEVAARLLLEARIGALPVRDGPDILGIFTAADALEALLSAIEPRPA